MDLEGVLAIGGKPGLYKMVAQSRGGVIVESMIENKRFPVSSSGNVSALKDIAIYTYGEEVPLEEVYTKIAEKEAYGKTIDTRTTKPEEWSAYLEEILPEYDKDRVYNSDLKKLFNWYNLLHDQGFIKAQETLTQEAKAEAESPSEEAEKSTEE